LPNAAAKIAHKYLIEVCCCSAAFKYCHKNDQQKHKNDQQKQQHPLTCEATKVEQIKRKMRRRQDEYQLGARLW
jgi:hypothetical protein